MHKVDIRLTSEGNDAATVFEIYSESLKDGTYVPMAPMDTVQGGGVSIVKMLEPDERIIVVAKGNKDKIVFDKDQNANVRVESEDELKDRADREARIAQHQADQAVKAAEAEVEAAKSAGDEAQKRAAANLKKAQAEASKVKEDQQKASGGISEGSGAPRPSSPKPPMPGSQAGVGAPPKDLAESSAAGAPLSSKQVKT